MSYISENIASPADIQKGYEEDVKMYVGKISEQVNLFLIDKYPKLQKGEMFLCNLEVALQNHEQSNGKLIQRMRFFAKSIAENIAEGYRLKGWAVGIDYLRNGEVPVLAFKIPDSDSNELMETSDEFKRRRKQLNSFNG